MRTIKTVRIGMFAAMTAVLAQISIPMPSGVPLSLQTFAVALSCFVLGAKNGSFSVLIYLLLGAVGLPVFTAFRSGFGVLFGSTGGFLWGFLILGIFCGLSVRQYHKVIKILFCTAGILLCHLLGVLQFMFVTHTDFGQAFLAASMPYLLKDALVVSAAFLTAGKVRRQLHYL